LAGELTKKLNVRFHYFIFILLFFNLLPDLTAQEDWPFVQYHSNRIRDTSPERAISFYQKAQAIRSGEDRQLRILHLGDSHVHADLWSEALRKNLADSLGITLCARGWLTPYATVGLAQPNAISVKHAGRWKADIIRSAPTKHPTGLSGISFTCHDPAAWISSTVSAPDGFSYKHDILEIYHEPCGRIFHKISGRFQVLDTEFLPHKGCTRYQLDCYTDTVHLAIDLSKNESFTLHGLNFSSSRRGLLFHSAGINGASFRYFPNAERLSKHIRATEPDMIILSLGTNDGLYDRFDARQFRKSVQKMLARIMISAPGAYIIICIPSDTPSATPRRRAKKDAVRKIMIAETQKYGLSYWSLYEMMGGEGSHQSWGRHGLITPDKIHFTPDGYRILAMLFTQALMSNYRHYFR
jgi:lysophospholipase L1-like esterase